MPKETQLDIAKRALADVEAAFEEFKKTPAYASAIAAREELKRLDAKAHEARDKHGEYFRLKGYRLGILDEKGAWSERFKVAVGAYFDGLSAEDRESLGKYERSPLIEVVAKIGHGLIERVPLVSAARAAVRSADEAKEAFRVATYDAERILREKERGVESARLDVFEAQRMWDLYVGRRDRAKARKEEVIEPGSPEEKRAEEKARILRAKRFLESNEDVPEAFAWEPRPAEV